MRDDANDANDDQTEPTLMMMMMMDAIIDNERRRATTMEETPETEPPPETTTVNAEPMIRTRNPREAHAMGRPKRIVAGIEECARAYCDESARRMRLGKAYARVKRASTSTPSARCAMTLCAQLIEACDVRRGMIARACGKLGRHGRACAATLEAFAECNEWTAVELSGATTVDGRSCDAAAGDRGDEEGVGGDGTGGESEIEEDRGGSDAGAGIGIAADDDADDGAAADANGRCGRENDDVAAKHGGNDDDG
jgi:hypothetical protein